MRFDPQTLYNIQLVLRWQRRIIEIKSSRDYTLAVLGSTEIRHIEGLQRLQDIEDYVSDLACFLWCSTGGVVTTGADKEVYLN